MRLSPNKTWRTRRSAGAVLNRVEGLERRVLMANLLANGDFGLGDFGFTSEYRNESNAGSHAVGSDPRLANPFLASFGDHTTGSGLMLIADGATDEGWVLWQQTVPVAPGKTYDFSGWGASAYGNAATLAFLINGAPVGQFPLSEEVGRWTRFSAAWDSGTSTTATIAVVDLNLDYLGNDFALDDLVFESATPAAPTHEAEQASITGAGVSATHSGFTGTGYVDFSHAAGDSVEFAVDAPAAGRYELSFRYANGGTSSRSLGLWLNGAAVPGGAAFAPTGSWRTWNALPITVPLVAGANKVRLLATGQSGPNLDSLSVAPVTPPESATYQAEAATLSGPVAASDVPGYTGGGFADYRHAARDYVAFAIEVPADGPYALDFRYANGGRYDRPLDLAVDGRPVARLSFAPTGSWRAWMTKTQSVLLNAGRHTVRLTATGRSGPNLDALTVRADRASIPPPAGMTGWWTGDGNARDIVGGRTGVFRGGATTGPGLVDGAFVLDGEDDFVDVPHDPALDAGIRDFTVDLWVYFNDTDGEQVLVEKWVQGEGFPSGWVLTKLAHGAIRFALAKRDRGEANVDSQPLAFLPSIWSHFAATREGDSATVYWNGAVVARSTSVGDCDVSTPSSLKFGHRGSPEDTPGSIDEEGFYLDGRVDEVELFIGTALTQGQVRAIYEAGPAGKTKG